MHNIDDRFDISDCIVKKLDKLSNSYITGFTKEFNNLIPYHQERYIYIKTVEKKNAGAMYGILNATKDASIFDCLLKSDKEFAFNTLDCVSPQSPLFKMLFNKLDQHRREYIKHVKEKKSAKAMHGILNATKDVRIFNGVLKSDKEFAFNTLDCIDPQYTLFKTLFGKLGKQHKNGYVKHVQEKKNAKAMYGMLNVTKDVGIFNSLLKSDKEFAFNTLDCVSPQCTLFKTLCDKLGQQHKNEYIRHVKGKKNSNATFGMLGAMKDVRIFDGVLKSDKEFAFNTLDCVAPQSPLFKTLFDKLEQQHKNKYIQHVKGKKNAKAMYGILNAKKDLEIFNSLLKSDKEFAFNTLDCVGPQSTLFKTLFDKLGQHRGKYIKHAKGKKNAKAMYGILNATKDARIFNGVLKSDKEFAFNTLDCVSPQSPLFKTLFDKLGKQHKNGYIKHAKGKKNAKAMYGILNATKDARIFNGVLKSDEEFAFNTLDCVSPQSPVFKMLFNKLGQQYKNEYIQHVKGKKNANALYGILNVTKDTIIFDYLLKSDKKFAFNTLDCVGPKCTLFKTLCDKLGQQHKNEYIQHVKGKKNANALYGILNVTKDTSIFDYLLKSDKKFAFNTLDCVGPKSAFFKTLFDKLDFQQKEDYKTHLGKKTTSCSKYILKNFYSSDGRNSKKAIPEGSNVDILEKVMIACDISTTESVDSVIPTLSNTENGLTNHDMLAVFKALENQLPDKLNFIGNQSLENLQESGVININTTTESVDSVIPTLSNTENGLTNHDMLSEFAALEDQLSDGLKFIESLSSNRGTQGISLLASNEFTHQDMLAVFEELENHLPDELNFIGSRSLNKRTQDTFLSALEEFHAREYELEGIHLEQPAAKRQRTE